MNKIYYKFESKQVGTLYHICSLSDFVEFIIPYDSLYASGNFTNKLVNRDDVISFTRDKLYMIKTLSNMYKKSKIFIQLVLDGNKLSNKYKIFPYNDFMYNGTKGEAEECIIGVVKHISNYIIGINFDFSEYKLQDFDYYLINKALNYYKNIKYFNFNKKLNHNPYNLQAGDNLHDLIKFITNKSNAPQKVIKYILYGSSKIDDDLILRYSKDDNIANLKYLIKEYGIDLNNLIYNNESIAIELLAKTINGSIDAKNMLNDLESLGLHVTKSDYVKATAIAKNELDNYNIKNTLYSVIHNGNPIDIIEYINLHKQECKQYIKNVIITDYINLPIFNTDVFTYIVNTYRNVFITLEFLNSIVNSKNYKSICKILIKNGLLDTINNSKLLSFCAKNKDYDLAVLLFNNISIDPFDDSYFSSVYSLYEDAIKTKNIELLCKILDTGFDKRLHFDIPRNEYIRLANNDSKLLNILNKYSSN